MKRFGLIAATVACCVLGGLGTAQADLVFDPVGETSGGVRVNQSVLGNGKIGVQIDLLVSEAYDTFAGGFRTIDGASFGQQGDSGIAATGDMDTGFLFGNPTGAPFELFAVDNAEELSVQSAARLGGAFNNPGEYVPFAQLILDPGATAEVFSPVPGSSAVEVFAAGRSLGTISGSVTAVPEPSSLVALAAALLGGLGIRVWVRRRWLSFA